MSRLPRFSHEKGAAVHDVHRRETAMKPGRVELGSSLQISKLAVGASWLFAVATWANFEIWTPDPGCLCEYRFDHFAVDVGQSVVAALKAVCQTGVVESEQVHDGRLQVVDMHFVLGD